MERFSFVWTNKKNIFCVCGQEREVKIHSEPWLET